VKLPVPVIKVQVRKHKSPRRVYDTHDYIQIFYSIFNPEDYAQYNIIAVFLSHKGEVLGKYHLARGTARFVMLDMSLLLNICLRLRATGVVIGQVTPWPAEVPNDMLLQQLRDIIQSLKMVNAKLEDYLIFDENADFTSLRHGEDLDATRIFEEEEDALPPFVID
jgi:DNA repair protein RadC